MHLLLCAVLRSRLIHFQYDHTPAERCSSGTSELEPEKLQLKNMDSTTVYNARCTRPIGISEMYVLQVNYLI